VSSKNKKNRYILEAMKNEDSTHHKIENRFFHDISISLTKLVNIIMMTIPFAVAWYSAYADKLWVRFAMRGHWLVIGLFVILFFSIGRIYDAFKISYSGIAEMVYSQMLARLLPELRRFDDHPESTVPFLTLMICGLRINWKSKLPLWRKPVRSSPALRIA